MVWRELLLEAFGLNTREAKPSYGEVFYEGRKVSLKKERFSFSLNQVEWRASTLTREETIKGNADMRRRLTPQGGGRRGRLPSLSAHSMTRAL